MANNKKLKIRMRKRSRGKAGQAGEGVGQVSKVLNNISGILDRCLGKLLVIGRFFLHPAVRIPIFIISLILNVFVAKQIFSFYIYVSDLQTKRTSYGLFPALFIPLLIPAMFLVYPVILLIHIGVFVYLGVFYWDRAKGYWILGYGAILLLWLFMLMMYAPALLLWPEY